MSYSISQQQQKGIPLVILKDDITGTEASISAANGALLHQFSVLREGHQLGVVDNYASMEELERELPKSYKSSKLSPFPCRIREGRYHYNEKDYQFKRLFADGSAIHGLLYNKPFAITGAISGLQEASVAMRYRYRRDDPGYPYDYDCQVEYKLMSDNLLQVRTVISNEDRVTLPIADGWHPYFQLGGKIDDWLMHFEAQTMVEFDDKLLPTGKLVSYDHFSEPARIGQTELDNCFLLKASRQGAACEVFNPQNKLKLSFYPDDSYPYLQIYTPPHRTSIAIENLSSAPDSFNNKMGLINLEPGHSHSFIVSYKISTV